MEIDEIREKLVNYIGVADDEKVSALYTLLEDDMAQHRIWWKDEAFLKELDEESKKYESGEEPGYSMEEVHAQIQEQLNKRNVVHV